MLKVKVGQIHEVLSWIGLPTQSTCNMYIVNNNRLPKQILIILTGISLTLHSRAASSKEMRKIARNYRIFVIISYRCIRNSTYVRMQTINMKANDIVRKAGILTAFSVYRNKLQPVRLTAMKSTRFPNIYTYIYNTYIFLDATCSIGTLYAFSSLFWQLESHSFGRANCGLITRQHRIRWIKVAMEFVEIYSIGRNRVTSIA